MAIEKNQMRRTSARPLGQSLRKFSTAPEGEEAEKPKKKVKEEKKVGFLDSIKAELGYAQELVDKFSGPKRVRKRTAEDIEVARKRWEEGGQVRASRGEVEEKKEDEVDFSLMSEKEREAYDAKEAAEAEVLEKLNATPLIHVGDDETVWEKRIAEMKERFRSTAPMKKLRGLRREALVSDNPAVAAARDMKFDLEDAVEDLTDTYETSQHPVVWKAREIADATTGETETGWAIGELRRVDPGFDMNLFLEDMEEYMIPFVIEGFLRNDTKLLKQITEEQAAAVIFAVGREREVKGHTWDTRILDISNIDFLSCSVEHDVPFITISFVCQHVHCIKDKKGEIVEGSESEIKSVYYIWKLRQDKELADFDYILTEFMLHRVYALV